MCSVVRLELKGVQNNVRVRQLQVLAYPSKPLDATLPSVKAQQKDCEGEALRLFRLLTSKVCLSLRLFIDEGEPHMIISLFVVMRTLCLASTVGRGKCNWVGVQFWTVVVETLTKVVSP